MLTISVVGAAHADQLLLRSRNAEFHPGLHSNVLFILFVNDSTRQGLQFDISYDPTLLKLKDVTRLGRLHDPIQLYHSVSPPGVLHVLVYDNSASRSSIGTGADSIVSLSFMVPDTTRRDKAVISLSDALAASETLVPVPIADQIISVPMGGVTTTLLLGFTATPLEDGSIRVEWELSPSAGDVATNLYRSFADLPERTKVNDAPVAGPGSHALVDSPPEDGGVLTYELVQMTSDGESSLGRIEVDRGRAAPLRFALHQNAPNPFSSSTLIRFDVPRQARVRLAVYDVAGRLVRVLRDGEMRPGRYSRAWDGRGARGEALPNGIYFYVAQTGRQRIVRKAMRLQ